MKYRTSLLAYALVVALFFAAGYGAGVINGRNRAREDFTEQYIIKPTDAVNTSALADEILPEYTVILENGSIIVYESEDENKTKLTECKISESVYPAEDVAALKNGMIFDNKNEAMAMFENFAS